MNLLKANNLPIGVFDSGVGGLTVLNALQTQLPNESFLYLGDTARLPYGTKSQDTVIQYTQQVTQLLITRGIKLLVIACNTATTFALPTLQDFYQGLPVIGVVEPGAKAACNASRNGHIAVIATEATVNANAYQNAIKKFRSDATVIAQGCSLFVALAEEGWIDGPITELIAKQYLEPLLNGHSDHDPDCLVLGCTHFPALSATIKKVIGNKITIIDSAKTTAENVAEVLMQFNLITTTKEKSTKFLVTDSPHRFARVAKHFLGSELNIADVELVTL